MSSCTPKFLVAVLVVKIPIQAFTPFFKSAGKTMSPNRGVDMKRLHANGWLIMTNPLFMIEFLSLKLSFRFIAFFFLFLMLVTTQQDPKNVVQSNLLTLIGPLMRRNYVCCSAQVVWAPLRDEATPISATQPTLSPNHSLVSRAVVLSSLTTGPQPTAVQERRQNLYLLRGSNSRRIHSVVSGLLMSTVCSGPTSSVSLTKEIKQKKIQF